MDILQGLLHAHFVFNGRRCVYVGRGPANRQMFTDGAGWYLEIPDPETGFPRMPTTDEVVILMADKALILRADPLADLVRERARKEEPVRQELIEAKLKHDPKRLRDHWYALREAVCRKWDEGHRCALSKAGVAAWFKEHFVVDELEATYGRVPSDRTFRKWVRERGTEGDRRPADYRSDTGLGIRIRRIADVPLAIIKGWALKFHSKPKQNQRAHYRRAKDDIERYNRGEELELFGFEKGFDKPDVEAKMCAWSLFQKEIERAKSATAFGVGHGHRAQKQRFGGGGVAQEPTRFLEYVQLDDTPFPIVFVFDPVHKAPCGVPTVTIALDVYTRVILGWDISFDTPSHSTFMRTMLHTALPKRVPKSHSRFRALGELCGKIVGHLVLDNAPHQTARAAQDAGGDIGTAVRWAGSKEPTHKGHVESCLETLQRILREMLPGSTYDIPTMREFDWNPAKQALVTIEQFREIFAAVVAAYHTTGHSAHDGRSPLEIWSEQRAEHGLDLVRDPDHFERAIANVSYVAFRGDGASINDLQYGSDGTDDRFPLSNEDILRHLSLARGVSSDTKKQSFKDVKIKWDPNDLGRAWLFDEHLREYVPIPCTRRRYADGLPLWLHERLKDWAKKKRLAFEEEHDMVKVRGDFAKHIAKILPGSTMLDNRAMARLADSSAGREYLGQAAEILNVAGSPSGMESVVRHELRTGTRKDANRKPPRSSRRDTDKAGRRDPRDAGTSQSIPESAERQLRDQDAYVNRRLDGGWSDAGYR
jgi:putative transposase